VHVAAGCLADLVDGVRDRHHVVGERPLEASLLPLGRAEVHDPWIGSVLAQDADRAGLARHVVHLGREHQRRHEQDRRATLLLLGVVMAEPVDALLSRQLVRRGLLVGGEAAEARDLERVLGGGADPVDRRGQRVGQQRHLRHILL
jgi:hypothetical protein